MDIKGDYLKNKIYIIPIILAILCTVVFIFNENNDTENLEQNNVTNAIDIINQCNLFNENDVIKETFTSNKDKISYDVLIVNRDIPLSEDYVPSNLVIPDVKLAACITLNEEKMIDKSIEKPVIDLFNGAKKEGVILYLLSGYRSYYIQKNLFEYNVNTQGKEYDELYVSKPGCSEHQTGLALDITNATGNFTGSMEAKWIEDNSYKYGFVIRYQKGKEKITGYNYEPWHIRYVGNEIAKKMYDENICLEELVKQN